MDGLTTFLTDLQWLPSVITIAFCAVGLALARLLLLGRRKATEARTETPWSQLTFVALILASVVAVIITLPIDHDARDEILSFLGIILTAAIALSSTTFLGNAMAGFMLRSLSNFQLGDFLRVGEAFGRVTVRGLLHTEIQTEDRDLTTLPNLTLVTSPVTVVHSTGTIVSATVSLGYDVDWQEVEPLLLKAAEHADLRDGFVQILELGDFSITYRVAGFLDRVKYLLTARSRLRSAMLDELHAAGIEIVSPTFMNQRAISDQAIVAGTGYRRPRPIAAKAPEDVIFDKAEQAQTRQELLDRARELQETIDSLTAGKSDEEKDAPHLRLQLSLLKREIARVERLIEELGEP